MGRPTVLTKENIALIAEYRKQQKTYKEISSLLNISLSTIQAYCTKIRLLTGRKPVEKEEKEEEILPAPEGVSEFLRKRVKHLHYQECTVAQIAERLGLRIHVVHRLLSEFGYAPHQETAYLTANEIQEKLDAYLIKHGLFINEKSKYTYGRGPKREVCPK